MNKLISDTDEVSLLKFIARYQYLNIKDARIFFESEHYYKSRIRKLKLNNYINIIDNYIVLTKNGLKFIDSLGLTCNKRIRDRRYFPRITYMSNLAISYHNSDNVTFTPSFEVKDKDIYTITSRRYIGILSINGTSYLTYHIRKYHDKKYIGTVIYDIQKEKQFSNFIILVEDLSMINYKDFIFSHNKVIIIQDNKVNRKKLKYLNNINWPLFIENEYPTAYLSPHIYCDYENTKREYISCLYLFDCEKVNKITQFLNVNEKETATIICTKEMKQILQKILPRGIYNVPNLEKYIVEKRNVYYEDG